MRIACILALTAAASATARADFSYTTSTKSDSGTIATTSKTYLKGQKIKHEYGSIATIIDFDAQTVTYLNNSRKTYSVTKFSEMGKGLQSGDEVAVDLKETGQRKVINGYNTSQVILDVTMSSTRQAGKKTHIEMELWVSPDVPGSQEMRAFYQKNADRFPWAVMASGSGGQGMQKAMADINRKMASLKGIAVQQAMRFGKDDADMAQMQQGLSQAQKQLEDLKKQGKLPAQLEQQLKLPADLGLGSMVLESTNFSTGPIPDSVFAIPAGYQQSAQR